MKILSLKETIPKILILIFFIFSYSGVNAQDAWWKDKKYKTEQEKNKFAECRSIFKEISYGLNYSSISSIKKYFIEQVYLDLSGNDKGYYSNSQAELILEDFMNYFQVSNFKYTKAYTQSSFAFALGNYEYVKSGVKRILNTYISLKYDEWKWYIDQIVIN